MKTDWPNLQTPTPDHYLVSYHLVGCKGFLSFLLVLWRPDSPLLNLQSLVEHWGKITDDDVSLS